MRFEVNTMLGTQQMRTYKVKRSWVNFTHMYTQSENTLIKFDRMFIGFNMYRSQAQIHAYALTSTAETHANVAHNVFDTFLFARICAVCAEGRACVCVSICVYAHT